MQKAKLKSQNNKKLKNKKITVFNYLKYITFAFLIFTFSFSFGCAKTVTNVNFGAQMIVTVTLRGNADVLANRYFMVLASGPAFKTPLPPPDNPNNFEFLEPDGTPYDASHPLADYFTNFFSTWAGYLVLSNGAYFSVPGPFVSGEAIGRNPLANFDSANPNKLVFNFQLNQIFSSGVPATAYFDVITVPWPASGPKIAADHLNSTNAYISTLSGSANTFSDPLDLSLDQSLDILTVEVTVQ